MDCILRHFPVCTLMALLLRIVHRSHAGDMDDDLDILCDLEAELGVAVSMHGLQDARADTPSAVNPGAADSRGNPVEPQVAAGGLWSNDSSATLDGASLHSGITDELAPSPQMAGRSRQERRTAAGLGHSVANSCTGASAHSLGFAALHHSNVSALAAGGHPSAASPHPFGDPLVDVPNSRQLPSYSADPSATPSRNRTPANAAIPRGVVAAPFTIPRLSLAKVNVVSMRAHAEAEGHAAQDESLMLHAPPMITTGLHAGSPAALEPRTAATGTPAQGPLSQFEGAAIHAQRGAMFKSQAAFLQHIRQQQDNASGACPSWQQQSDAEVACSGAAQGTFGSAARATPGGAIIGSNRFHCEAEARSRLIYSAPALHVALLTLMLNLLLTAVRCCASSSLVLPRPLRQLLVTKIEMCHYC